MVTGIVRKIDNLGRVVIPKEIRSSLKLEEGDSMEILLQNTGEILLKKYDELENGIEIVQNLAKGISRSLNANCYIVDKNNLIATYPLKKEELEYNIEEIISVAEEREIFCSKEKIIVPLCIDSVLKGAIVVTAKNKVLTEKECKVVEITSKIIEEIIA